MGKGGGRKRSSTVHSTNPSKPSPPSSEAESKASAAPVKRTPSGVRRSLSAKRGLERENTLVGFGRSYTEDQDPGYNGAASPGPEGGSNHPGGAPPFARGNVASPDRHTIREISAADAFRDVRDAVDSGAGLPTRSASSMSATVQNQNQNQSQGQYQNQSMSQSQSQSQSQYQNRNLNQYRNQQQQEHQQEHQQQHVHGGVVGGGNELDAYMSAEVQSHAGEPSLASTRALSPGPGRAYVSSPLAASYGSTNTASASAAVGGLAAYTRRRGPEAPAPFVNTEFHGATGPASGSQRSGSSSIPALRPRSAGAVRATAGAAVPTVSTVSTVSTPGSARRKRKGFLLLVDTSNSMMKRVHPDELAAVPEEEDRSDRWTLRRIDALEHSIVRICEFLEPNDYLGAVAFDAGVSPILRFQPVSMHTDGTLEMARSIWNAGGSGGGGGGGGGGDDGGVDGHRRGGKNTDFRLVMEMALQAWLDDTNSPSEVHVIMLTDMHPRPVCSSSLDLAKGLRIALQDLLAQTSEARPGGRAHFHFLMYAPSLLPFARDPEASPLPPGAVHIRDDPERRPADAGIGSGAGAAGGETANIDAFVRGILGLTYVGPDTARRLRPLFRGLRRRALHVYTSLRESHARMPAPPPRYEVQGPAAQRSAALRGFADALERSGPAPLETASRDITTALRAAENAACEADAAIAARVSATREELHAEMTATVDEIRRGDAAFMRRVESDVEAADTARKDLEARVAALADAIGGASIAAADIAAVAEHVRAGACGKRWDELEVQMEMLRVRMGELEARRPLGRVDPEKQLDGAKGRLAVPTYDPESDKSFLRVQGAGGPGASGASAAGYRGSGAAGIDNALTSFDRSVSAMPRLHGGRSAAMRGAGSFDAGGGDAGAEDESRGGKGRTAVSRWIDSLTVGKALGLAFGAFALMIFVIFLALVLYHYSIARKTPDSEEIRFSELELRVAATEGGIAGLAQQFHDGGAGVVNLASDPSSPYAVSVDPRGDGSVRVRDALWLESGLDLVEYGGAAARVRSRRNQDSAAPGRRARALEEGAAARDPSVRPRQGTSSTSARSVADEAEARGVATAARIALGRNGTLSFRPGASGVAQVNASMLLVSGGGVTADAVSAATVNTGHGDNEVHPMDQALRTGDAPRFAGVRVSGAGRVSLGDSGAAALQGSADGSVIEATAPVHVKGAVTVDGALTSLGSAPPSFAGGLRVNGSLLHVDPARGRVGINAANPESALHVSGDARVDGQLVVNGQVAAFGISARDATARSLCAAGLAAGLAASTGGQSLTFSLQPYDPMVAQISATCDAIAPTGFYFTCGVVRPGFGLHNSPIGEPEDCTDKLEVNPQSSFVRASDWEAYRRNVTQCTSANVMVCCSPQCQGW